jgi:hypothetical protein
MKVEISWRGALHRHEMSGVGFREAESFRIRSGGESWQRDEGESDGERDHVRR